MTQQRKITPHYKEGILTEPLKSITLPILIPNWHSSQNRLTQYGTPQNNSHSRYYKPPLLWYRSLTTTNHTKNTTTNPTVHLPFYGPHPNLKNRFHLLIFISNMLQLSHLSIPKSTTHPSLHKMQSITLFSISNKQNTKQFTEPHFTFPLITPTIPHKNHTPIIQKPEKQIKRGPDPKINRS